VGSIDQLDAALDGAAAVALALWVTAPPVDSTQIARAATTTIVRATGRLTHGRRRLWPALMARVSLPAVTVSGSVLCPVAGLEGRPWRIGPGAMGIGDAVALALWVTAPLVDGTQIPHCEKTEVAAWCSVIQADHGLIMVWSWPRPSRCLRAVTPSASGCVARRADQAPPGGMSNDSSASPDPRRPEARGRSGRRLGAALVRRVGSGGHSPRWTSVDCHLLKPSVRSAKCDRRTVGGLVEGRGRVAADPFAGRRYTGRPFSSTNRTTVFRLIPNFTAIALFDQPSRSKKRWTSAQSCTR
jgi:hypothetical protein